MRISECMTQDVRLVEPDETLEQAAQAMAEIDAGILPVGENGRLVGMVSDRDIAIRGVAQGRQPSAKVREVMSPEVCYCFIDDEAEDVLDNIAQIQVRRLPVLDRDKRLVGIVSISDFAGNGETAHIGEALAEIARPSRLHVQVI